jgi:hypothetical protein
MQRSLNIFIFLGIYNIIKVLDESHYQKIIIVI